MKTDRSAGLDRADPDEQEGVFDSQAWQLDGPLLRRRHSLNRNQMIERL